MFLLLLSNQQYSSKSAKGHRGGSGMDKGGILGWVVGPRVHNPLHNVLSIGKKQRATNLRVHGGAQSPLRNRHRCRGTARHAEPVRLEGVSRGPSCATVQHTSSRLGSHGHAVVCDIASCATTIQAAVGSANPCTTSPCAECRSRTHQSTSLQCARRERCQRDGGNIFPQLTAQPVSLSGKLTAAQIGGAAHRLARCSSITEATAAICTGGWTTSVAIDAGDCSACACRHSRRSSSLRHGQPAAR